MSLTSCLRDAGDALSRENRRKVLALSRRYRGEGMASDPAALRAIDEVMAGLQDQLKTEAERATGDFSLTLPRPGRPNGSPLASIDVKRMDDGRYAAGRGFMLEKGGESASAVHFMRFATPDEAIRDAVDYLRGKVEKALRREGGWSDIDDADVKRAESILRWLDKQAPASSTPAAPPASTPATPAPPTSGLFDEEFARRDAAAKARREERLAARRKASDDKRAALMADQQWRGGPFEQRIVAVIERLEGAGLQSYADTWLLGFNADAKAGQLTEERVKFREDKAQQVIAQEGAKGAAVKWEPRTVDDLRDYDPTIAALPQAIVQAAADKFNALGVQLAKLGYTDHEKVNTASPQESQRIAGDMRSILNAMMILAPRRYRVAKGYKNAKVEKLKEAEDYATEVLGIDTTAHPDINLSVQLTSFGEKQAPAKRRARAKSADTLRAEADLSSALADLGEILGKKVSDVGGAAYIVPPEVESKLLPVLTRVLDAAFRLGYHSFKDAAKFALDTIREKLGGDIADALTLDHLQGAYIAMAGGKEGADSKRAVIDVESKADIEQHVIDEEQDDVSGGTTDLERDRGGPAGQPDAGAGVPGNVAAGADAGTRQPRAGRSGGSRGTRTPDGGPVAGGKRVNQRVDGGKRPDGPAPGDSGADFDERGGAPGGAGVQPDADAGAAPADGPERVRSESERRELQRQVDERVRRGELKVRLADRASIDETLPFLLPAQRDDVYKAELRHAKPDGYGMLFTNGTGTGKTYSGLGVIKRRQLLGEVDQFIVVPDNKIAADWIESAKNLTLTVNQLPDTKSAGEGIVITTFANLGENDELAKRKFKHVLADEAHSLMQSAEGVVTSYLENLRALTYHPEGQHAAWMMRHREQHEELASLTKSIEGNNRIIGNPDTMEQMVAALREENKKLQLRVAAIARDLGAKREAIRAEWAANQREARTRATFLSATPFAYHTSLEWAQGFLFDYAEGYPYELDGSRPYNQPNPKQYFFMTHLGYRMRYNKLTKPETSKVDVGMLERGLNSWMKRQGSLSGRMLEVEPDYDRRFIAIDSAIGNKIDEAIEYLRDQANEQYQRNRDKKPDEPKESGWGGLQNAITDQFDYLSRRYLLEAIKAKEAVPIVREHMRMGRRVVVFHDYKKGSGINPFDVPEAKQPKASDFDKMADPQKEFEDAKRKVDGFNAARAQFRRQFPELFRELVELKPPIEAFREAFEEGVELLVINGDEKPKELLKRYARFQSDEGGPLVALVQSDKNKGWSGHDTTGKHQRVLVNLGLPTAPTKLIQLEGRIYRTGVVTDAIMRSLNTGTNWERWAFASTIASRASTAENLGMGELSRALRDSIIASFEGADRFPPGHEGEGKGGKALDRAANNVLSDFDRAKTFYWATGKKTSRNKSEEGKDYFATPEPLGLKMVEWADVRPGEDVLEPSAGHGAIARWFPELSNRTAIEPAPVLMSKLGMAMNPAKDRLVDGTFEDHDIVNKYDAIVMNPPFGVGGKQAIEHVAKAARHLRDGGRIVALIPAGPAADKRLEHFLYGKEERPVKELGELRGPSGIKTTIYRGDRIESRASWAPKGVITGLGADGKTVQVHVDGTASGMTTAITVESITKVEPTGKRTHEVSLSEGLQLVADIKLPSVTFERAGTAVWSHIIVLEKTKEDIGTTKQVDLTGIESTNELFDRIEKMGLRARAKPVEDADAAPAATPAPTPAPVAQVERGDEPLIEHITQKGKTLRGIVRRGITRAQAEKIDPYTFNKDGGFFIREKYLKDNTAREPEPEYQPFEVDLFGNAIPQPTKVEREKKPRKKREPIRQQALDLEGGELELPIEPPRPPRNVDPQLYVDTVLFKAYERELGTDSIPTAAQLAAATRYLARGAVERLDLVLTDAKHKPLAVIGAFKGDRTQTPAYPFTVVAEALQVEGAKHLWLSHNHPSGNPTLSPADIRLTRTFDRALEGMGIKVMGIVAVTNAGKFSEWYVEDGSEDTAQEQVIPEAQGSPMTVPVLERELRDERLAPVIVRSPQHAQELGAGFYLRSQGPGIMVLDAQNGLAGWIPLSDEQLSSLRVGTGLRRLMEAATRGNTSSVVLVHGGELLAGVGGDKGVPRWKNIVNALTRSDIRVLDVVDVKTNTSLAAKGEALHGGGELFAVDRGSIWRSELEEQVSKATMKQAPAKQWSAFIEGLTKKGVKPMEIEWSGVRDWLAMLGDTKVAREEVLIYLGTNGVRIKEVVKGKSVDDMVREFDDLIVKMDAEGFAFDRRAFDDGDADYFGRPILFRRRSDGSYWQVVSNGLLQFSDDGDPSELPEADRRAADPSTEQHAMAKRLRELADNEVGQDSGEEDTRFETYTEPGGENYRELLLTLPIPDLRPQDVSYEPLTELPKGYEASFDSSQRPDGQWHIIPPGQMHGRPYAGRWSSPEEARKQALDFLNMERRLAAEDEARKKIREGVFNRSHWYEENVVAHIRMKDRVIPAAGVDMADIERRIVAAVGAKSAQTLGNGAGSVAVRKGAVTADEAAWYAHYRGWLNVDARPVPQERVLFIEEIQSDWAQMARTEGIKKPIDPQAVKAAAERLRAAEAGLDAAASTRELADDYVKSLVNRQSRLSDIYQRHPDKQRREEAGREIDTELMPAIAQAIAKRTDADAALRAAAKEKRDAAAALAAADNPPGVPGAPFIGQTDAWVALALKRIVHFAATGGYDKVAFISGRQTADRYNMRQHFQAIAYERNADGTWKLGVRPMGASANSTFLNEVGGTDLSRVEDSALPGIVGGELAARMRAGEGKAAWGQLDDGATNPLRILTGLDLEVGGEGHLAFYDKIVPAAIKRLLPKVGGGQLIDVPLRLGGRYRGGISGVDAMTAAGVPRAEQPRYWENLSQQERDDLIEKARNRPIVPTQIGFAVTEQMREAVRQGLPLFNRPRMTTEEVREQLAAARGTPVPKVRETINRLTRGWKGGIDVQAVATARDLPTSDAPAGTKGLYQNGVGYVVAAAVRTPQDIGRVIAHEVIAHYGIRNTLGADDWQRVMKQVQAAADAGNPEIAAAREYVRTAYRGKDGKYLLTEGGTIEADEVVARLIEQSVDENGELKPKLAFLKWVWSKIAAFLRDTFPKLASVLPLTMPELHGIYVQALRDIRAGVGQQAVQAPALAATEGRGFNTRQIQVGGKWRPIDDSRGRLLGADFTAQTNFWRWFRDSKAVDDEGHPLALYHGTRADFNSFGPAPNYFSPDPSYASMFAWLTGVSAGAKVMPVYARITNPLDARSLGLRNLTFDEFAAFIAGKGITMPDDELQRMRELIGDGMGSEWWYLFRSSRPLQAAIKAAGYDGMIQVESVEDKVSDAYVTFEPSQLKSATGNSGAFDPKNDDVRYAIDIAGGAARSYTPEQMAAMRNVGFARELPPLKDRLRAMWKDAGKRLAQGIVDQFAPIKDISKEAYGLLRLSKGASGAFEVLLHGGLLKLNAGVYDFDEKKRGGAIERWLVPLQGEHHDFLRWVAANRAEQLTAEDRERLFTADDIRALKTLADGTLDFDYKLAHGPKAGKTTRSRAEAYADSLTTFNEFNKNTLDMAEQSGLIDKDSRALWEKEFYVPFYRVEDEGGVRGMNIKSGVVRQQAFKHLKGGTQQLNLDLLENTLMNWAHLIDAAAKNRAAKATLEAMQNLGAAVEAPEEVVRQIGRSMSKRNNVVWFMDEGRRRHFLIDDPHLLAAVSALEFSGFNSPVMQALGTAKRWLTVGVTASPFFKVRNLIRDTVQAIGTAPLGANPLQNLREGASVVGAGTFSDRNTDEWYRLLAGGGTIHFGTMLEGSEAKRVQALVEKGVDRATILDSADKVQAFYRKTVEPLITAYNELGNRGEAINRAALYQQLRKQGVSHAEASLQARDLMDFSMQGSFTTVRFLTQVVPFMNARLQGMYKLGRAAAEDPTRFGAVVLATSVLSIGLLAAYGDDDDWKKREDWDRNNYWWFKAGGIAYRIPKPFEIGAVATLAERTWELAFEREMTAPRFRAQVVALLGDQLALNPVPQLVKPIIDVYANKDSFTDRPIETMGMEKLQPQFRYREDTSMLARGASTVLAAGARAIGAEGPSPVQIEHLVRGYFGWLGTIAVSAVDVLARPATSQPAQPAPDWWKVLTGSIASKMEDAPSRYVSQVYEQAKALEQVYGTWRYLVREGKVEEARAFRDEYAEELARYRQAEAVKRAMTGINQLKRRVEEGGGSPEEKRQQLRELNNRADAIARRLAPL